MKLFLCYPTTRNFIGGFDEDMRIKMKWPLSITFIRHAESEYNDLRRRKEVNPEYREFKEVYNADFRSPRARQLAKRVQDRYSLRVSDYETPLTKIGEHKAEDLGKLLAKPGSGVPTPDIVFYSPYKRTLQTLEFISLHWEVMRRNKVPWVADDRIREQEHGLSLLYNDWRVFNVFHPEQRELRELLGPYWYQYPQGESVSQVRDRARSFTSMLIRECAGKHVFVITHHLTILSFRANYERLSPEQFIDLDQNQKPVNCGVTIYRGDPDQGSDGRLILEAYNKKFC